MNLFNTNSRNLLACVTLLIAGAFNSQVFAQVSGLTDDGWHTWQVPAVSSAPEMCCFSWQGVTGKRQGCDLDSRSGGFSTSSDGVNSTGDLQVFVHVEKGDVTRIRALSASCPVTSDSPILDLGPVAAGESIAWLENHIAPNLDLASEAIMAAAVHEGQAAVELLLKTANSNDGENREDAIFWMAQVRVGETSTELKTFIFDDLDPDIREHAAFAYSQSEADDIAAVLIRQGRNDEDPDVRSQAWFWLAQSKAPESEDAIKSAISEDNDNAVREEAVFALSQLPDDRAVKALAGLLEDSSFNMAIREQALFWLAQAESDEAFEYIDRILSDN